MTFQLNKPAGLVCAKNAFDNCPAEIKLAWQIDEKPELPLPAGYESYVRAYRRGH